MEPEEDDEVVMNVLGEQEPLLAEQLRHDRDEEEAIAAPTSSQASAYDLRVSPLPDSNVEPGQERQWLTQRLQAAQEGLAKLADLKTLSKQFDEQLDNFFQTGERAQQAVEAYAQAAQHRNFDPPILQWDEVQALVATFRTNLGNYLDYLTLLENILQEIYNHKNDIEAIYTRPANEHQPLEIVAVADMQKAIQWHTGKIDWINKETEALRQAAEALGPHVNTYLEGAEARLLNQLKKDLYALPEQAAQSVRRAAETARECIRNLTATIPTYTLIFAISISIGVITATLLVLQAKKVI